MGRFVIVVLDSFGVGAMPDADRFGDAGADTMLHIRSYMEKKEGGLRIPHMEKLGLYHIDGVTHGCMEHPSGCYGKCAEKSDAKDTINGHFEIAGLIVEKPFRVYPDGFPERIVKELSARTGVSYLGNCAASGTEIIRKLGDEHVRTGKPILYTSADSVMQIAMHEKVIELERQYEICRIAREMMVGDDTIGRIICRPFLGADGEYYRTENRKDFAMDPPGTTLLDILKEAGKDVLAVGKIEDIFNRRGITKINHTKNNAEGTQAAIDFLKTDFDGLLFVNLVDFDMLYGHRNDPYGYGKALEAFDERLPELTENLREEDILVITADHGCDPTYPGTDHTREYTPLLVYGKQLRQGMNLGIRATFADIAATAAEYFGVEIPTGTSFLREVRE